MVSVASANKQATAAGLKGEGGFLLSHCRQEVIP